MMHVALDIDGIEFECIPMHEGFMEKNGGREENS